MRTSVFGCTLWVIGACAGSPSTGLAQTNQQAGLTQTPQVEDIYVARSVRESRGTPTEFCSKARSGLDDAVSESNFTFRSTATRATDGLVIDANVKTIGSLHACFGRTSNPAVVSFYGEGILGGTVFKGLGECRSMKSDFPERGLNAQRCFLDLSGLPDNYIGGLLTTNTMDSLKRLGTESDPPGYVQPSIATIRLWKKR